MFGKYETEYGIRMGTTNKPVWYGSKSERDGKLKAFNKNAKGGKESKAIQRQVKITSNSKVVNKVKNVVKKNDCKGGTCKRNNYCTKHAKAISGSEYELYDAQGRNKNTKRWDE
jgi:hypothetical protein